MAELSAKDLILLCPTALPCWWVWSHGGAQDQNLQSLQESRGSSTLLRYYCSAPESRAEQCVCLCVKGWNWKLLPFCPSQFVPSRAGKYFPEYAAREWGQWGISSLLFRLTCSPSFQQWLTKFLSCRLESSSGVTPRPRGKAGNKLEWRASSQHHSARTEDLASRSLMAIKTTVTASGQITQPPQAQGRRRGISAQPVQHFCFCHALL